MQPSDDDPFDEVDFESIIRELLGDDAFQPIDDGGQLDIHSRVETTDGTVRVIADLPGASKDDLSVECNGTNLKIEVDGYGESVTHLPAEVDPESASATFNNGVLEVTLDIVESSAVEKPSI